MELYQYLFKKKIKQHEFAKLAKCGPVSLSKIVHKKISPSLTTAVSIVKCTGGLVTYEELLSEKAEAKANRLGIL